VGVGKGFDFKRLISMDPACRRVSASPPTLYLVEEYAIA